MGRAVVLAALVLCAAFALAHGAGRVLQGEGDHQVQVVLGFDAGPWLPQPPAEAPSPYAGGVATRGAGGGGGGYGDAIVDVLWYVFRWANDAYATAAGKRKDH